MGRATLLVRSASLLRPCFDTLFWQHPIPVSVLEERVEAQSGTRMDIHARHRLAGLRVLMGPVLAYAGGYRHRG